MVLGFQKVGVEQEKKAELEKLLNSLAENLREQAEIREIKKQKKELLKQIKEGRKQKPDDKIINFKYFYPLLFL